MLILAISTIWPHTFRRKDTTECDCGNEEGADEFKSDSEPASEN